MLFLTVEPSVSSGIKDAGKHTRVAAPASHGLPLAALMVASQIGHRCSLQVILEVFNPATGALIVRWDIDIIYGWTGDGGFWTDTEQLKYHIRKAGVAPGNASYDILLKAKPGRPDVAGWGPGSYRSTDGFVRHSLGSTIGHNGLGGSAAYWRRS